MSLIRKPSAAAPVHTSIIVIDVEILFPTRAFRANDIEKSRKLSIAHLITIDRKFRDADFVHRLLILRVVSGFPLNSPAPIRTISVSSRSAARADFNGCRKILKVAVPRRRGAPAL